LEVFTLLVHASHVPETARQELSHRRDNPLAHPQDEAQIRWQGLRENHSVEYLDHVRRPDSDFKTEGLHFKTQGLYFKTEGLHFKTEGLHFKSEGPYVKTEGSYFKK